MRPITFGLIGCGWIGGLHAAVINGLDNAELTAVSDINEAAGSHLSSLYHCRYYQDYMALLNDPNIQAVSICLPSGMHGKLAVEALRHGKHVICEKPMEISLEKGEEMIQAAKTSGRKISIIMQHRFDPPIIALKKAISENVIGRILWAASRTLWYRDDKYYSNGWRGTWKYDGGGALMNQSIHYIDLLLYLMGDVRSVSAKCRNLLHSQIETEDIGIADLEFENGSLGTIEGATLCYPGEGSQLCVFAENGSVIIKDDCLISYHLKDQTEYAGFEALLGEKPQINPFFGLDERSHKMQYEDFTAAILNDREPLVNGEEALRSIQVIQKIYEASWLKTEVYL